MPPVVEFLSRGSLDVAVAVNLLAAGALYVVGARHVSRRDPDLPWPRRASAVFLVGLVMLALVHLGPMGAWSHTFLWVHMTQHLVSMMVAAPLLVLGAPVTLAFRAASPLQRRRVMVPALRSRAVRWLTDPFVTWFLFAGVLIGAHFTPFYDWALRNHDADVMIEKPLFLVVGFLFYFPLIGSNLQPRRPSYPVRLLSMASVMIPEAVVGAVIFFASTPLYPAFAEAARPFGPDVLLDQHLAGAAMWALIMVADSFWLMDMAVAWMRSEEVRTRRIDAQIAAEQAAPRAPATTGTTS